MSCFSNSPNSSSFKTTFLSRARSAHAHTHTHTQYRSFLLLSVHRDGAVWFVFSQLFVREILYWHWREQADKKPKLLPENSYTWILNYVSCRVVSALAAWSVETCRDTKCPTVNTIVQGSWIDSTWVGCNRLCAFPDDTAPTCFSLFEALLHSPRHNSRIRHR
jgi:hypothetical protein